MTWAEFKAEMERQGVQDEDEIDYIDIDPGWGFTVACAQDRDGSWSVSAS